MGARLRARKIAHEFFDNPSKHELAKMPAVRWDAGYRARQRRSGSTLLSVAIYGLFHALATSFLWFVGMMHPFELRSARFYSVPRRCGVLPRSLVAHRILDEACHCSGQRLWFAIRYRIACAAKP